MPVRHTTHVVRVALLFLAGITVFVIARRAFVPPDFGTLGYFRAGALDDVRAQKIVHAGAKACDECHAGTWREALGPAIGDSLAAARARLRFVRSSR